jgi:hypothetical protein
MTYYSTPEEFYVCTNKITAIHPNKGTAETGV